jgi:hypothetical protein
MTPEERAHRVLELVGKARHLPRRPMPHEIATLTAEELAQLAPAELEELNLILETERRERLRADLSFFASECLRIKAKSGETIPLRFNRAQTYLHTRLEEQRQRTGKVRTILLKGRQTGFSTAIGARFYHRTALTKGIQTFISCTGARQSFRRKPSDPGRVLAWELAR